MFSRVELFMDAGISLFSDVPFHSINIQLVTLKSINIWEEILNLANGLQKVHPLCKLLLEKYK